MPHKLTARQVAAIRDRFWAAKREQEYADALRDGTWMRNVFPAHADRFGSY